MHLPTRVHILVTALRVRVISPSRKLAATQWFGLVALLVLSYQPRVLRYPERSAKTGTLMVKAPLFLKAPLFQALSNLRIFETVKSKYWQQ